ncbi:MAG: hypothetical protein KGM47_12585 [Acidobacteriota bacterium]|nr:hypothetical protein [Acidobacteriota bacterium]
MSRIPASQPDAPPSSLKILLQGAIDYAGLFPPAAVSMSVAVANYAAYRKGEFAWMLGNFVVAASRLEHFQKAFDELPESQNTGEPWRLSTIADQEGDFETLRKFISKAADRPRAMIESLEIRASSPDEILAASREIPSGCVCYFELPVGDGLEDCMGALRQCGACAKVRCGGVKAGKFISPEDLARFIQLCARTDVSFKATAGLHHPLRGRYAVTDNSNSPVVMMHGFLNVLMAAAFAKEGANEAAIAALLQDESPFRFGPGGVWWHDQLADSAQLSKARRFIHSFGSCSFAGPIQDLQSLGLT